MNKIQRSNKSHNKLTNKAKNMGIYTYHKEVIQKQSSIGRLLTTKEKQAIYKKWL